MTGWIKMAAWRERRIIGSEAFSKAHDGESVVHYGPQKGRELHNWLVGSAEVTG